MTAQLWQVSDLPASIARRIVVHERSGCWVVTGSTDRDGYARIGGKMAHRVIWEELVGPIPPKLVLDHREDWGCEFKNCGNPAHLLPVTNRVNCTRNGARGVSAINIRKTHCGHCKREYDLFNTYVSPDGRRDCRACIRRRVAEYKKRQQAARLTAATLARAA